MAVIIACFLFVFLSSCLSHCSLFFWNLYFSLIICLLVWFGVVFSWFCFICFPAFLSPWLLRLHYKQMIKNITWLLLDNEVHLLSSSASQSLAEVEDWLSVLASVAQHVHSLESVSLGPHHGSSWRPHPSKDNTLKTVSCIIVYYLVVCHSFHLFPESI